MGNWYANITLLGPTQDQTLTALRALRRRAFTAQLTPAHVVVYDYACSYMDGDDSERLAAALSERFTCPALIALNADDDVLWLCLYKSGHRVGEYDSSTPARSGASMLARGLGRPFLTPLLGFVLQMPCVFEFLRHMAVCKVLGLPGDLCTTTYPADDWGELDPSLSAEIFRSSHDS